MPQSSIVPQQQHYVRLLQIHFKLLRVYAQQNFHQLLIRP
jgi:hypothetical protein